MQKRIVSKLAVIGMAAAIIVPSAYVAYGRSYRDGRGGTPTLSVSQGVDRADARIADLKADLRLTADQAKNWPGLKSALHDIATKRAEKLAGDPDLKVGRSSSETSGAETSPATDERADVADRAERNARNNPKQDDIAAMRTEADELATQSANLRQLSDAAKPLYDSLDNRQRRRLVQFVQNDLWASETEHSRDWRR